MEQGKNRHRLPPDRARSRPTLVTRCSYASCTRLAETRRTLGVSYPEDGFPHQEPDNGSGPRLSAARTVLSIAPSIPAGPR
jgi:hypothetical protein